MSTWLARRRRARLEIRRLAASGRAISRGFVPHVGWLWHAPGDQLLGLLRQGYFEAREQAFAWLYLRPGDVVVDGGAHVGLYSVLAARAARGRARVLSIEANPATADLLQANLDENGVRGALVRRAIWSRAGTVRFETEQPDRAVYARVAFAPGAAAAEIPSTTIDAVLGEHGIDRPAFVKLDVEGAEPEALEGAAAALARGACPVWMIEFTEANLAARGWTTVQLGERVRSHGLLPCELDEDRLQLRPLSTAEPLWFANVLAVRDLDAVNARLRTASARNREIALDVLARARACRRFEELEELERLRSLAATAEENAAWARRTEALLADARALAEANAGWARRTEALLADARALAEGNERWARNTEAMLADERARSAAAAAETAEKRGEHE